MAAKKKASAKKRTPAQRRATANLVAMNKKKRAAKKTASKKKTTRRAPMKKRASRVRPRATVRKRNPVGANQWKGSHHLVKFVPRTTTQKKTAFYVTGLNKEGTGVTFSDSRNAAALFALGAAQNILYLARRKAEEAGWSGHMEIDSYHFEAWN